MYATFPFFLLLLCPYQPSPSPFLLDLGNGVHRYWHRLSSVDHDLYIYKRTRTNTTQTTHCPYEELIGGGVIRRLE